MLWFHKCILSEKRYKQTGKHISQSIGAGSAAEQMAYVNKATLHCPGKVAETKTGDQALRLTQQSGSANPGPQHPALRSLSSLVTINPPQTNRNPICSNK